MERTMLDKIRKSGFYEANISIDQLLLDWIDKLENMLNDFRMAGFNHEALLQTRDEMLRTLGNIWE